MCGKSQTIPEDMRQRRQMTLQVRRFPGFQETCGAATERGQGYRQQERRSDYLRAERRWVEGIGLPVGRQSPGVIRYVRREVGGGNGGA